MFSQEKEEGLLTNFEFPTTVYDQRKETTSRIIE